MKRKGLMVGRIVIGLVLVGLLVMSGTVQSSSGAVPPLVSSSLPLDDDSR